MPVSSLPPTLAPTLACERPQDRVRVDGLIEQAFGPGRFAKAAERLREGNAPRLDLSFVAWSDQHAVGCVRQWPIAIGGAPALLLGPFAVEDAWRSRGLGGELIERACEQAKAHGHDLVLLVGDESFFGRFGFRATPPGQVVMPGPVDPRRVLWRSLKGDPAPAAAGPVRAAPVS